MTRACRCQYALQNKVGLPTSGAGVDIPCRRSTDLWRRREVCAKSVDRLLASKVLKELSSVTAKPLAKLFPNSLIQGVVPNDWREAYITALFKKGSKSTSENYRAVSLTSVICKLMELIIKY